jgi:muramoyltetrapeptide carboxypeptidase
MLDRRQAIATIGALGAACAVPAFPAAGNAGRKPPRLRIGDTVGLVEPAGFSDGPEHVAAVEHTIRGMGLVPKVGNHVAARHGYLAGTDAERAADLNAMFADDTVRAIFAVRGGWGSARILPLLDWDTIRANPKLLIGSSDITALHLAIAARAGFPTIHGPNAASSWRETSWQSLWRLAFAGEAPLLAPPGSDLMPPPWAITTIRPGLARGKLLGGNLTVLAALAGTPWLPDFEGAILFLEDTGEAEYRIDRLFSQLALSGILGKVAGVAFGQCTRCSGGTPDYIGFTVPEILRSYLEPLNVPAVYGARIGHIADQLCLPAGATVQFDGESGGIRLLDPIVV